MGWEALAGIATAVTALILLKHLAALRSAAYTNSFVATVSILQAEKVREARATMMQFMGRPFQSWAADPFKIAEAERVCHTYDTVGIMVRHGMLPKRMIIDSWGDSLRKLWPVLRPLVRKYRKDRKAEEFWKDFQWLAEEAQSLKVGNLRSLFTFSRARRSSRHAVRELGAFLIRVGVRVRRRRA